MKTMTIGKRIFYISGFLCVVITIMSGFSIDRMRSLKTISNDITKDSIPGMIAAGEINANLGNNQLRLYRLLFADTFAEREDIKKQIAETSTTIADYVEEYRRSAIKEEDKALFKAMIDTREEYLKARNNFISVVETNKPEAQKMLVSNLRTSFLAYSKAANTLLVYNKTSAEKNGVKLSTQVDTNVKVIGIVSIICLGIGVLASIWSIKVIVKNLSMTSAVLGDSATQVASAASQITGSSQSLAEGSSEQAASLEETSSSLEEMASMTKQNSENANKAKELANQARMAADTGSSDMEAMNAAMEGIRESSNDIAKIIKTIDEIAFQTNILALNAAVEAARAGEAGMGFAVVAEEVRNLAQRSALAAKETAAKIEGAILKTNQGVDISSKVAQTLQEIVTKVRKVDELITEVAMASREQSQGIEQVTSAVSQMDQVTQSNAAIAEESASASQELDAQAHMLKQAVIDLLELVGNSAQAAPDQSQSPSVKKSPKPVQVETAKQSPQPALALNSIKRKATPSKTVVAISRQSEIPLDNDFADFGPAVVK